MPGRPLPKSPTFPSEPSRQQIFPGPLRGRHTYTVIYTTKTPATPGPPPQACYLTQYQGRDRGVLVQLGTLQLGHFPLGLWDEARANPPPLMA